MNSSRQQFRWRFRIASWCTPSSQRFGWAATRWTRSKSLSSRRGSPAATALRYRHPNACSWEWLDCFQDERFKASCRCVRHMLQPDPPDAGPGLLRGHRHQGLLRAGTPRRCPLLAAHVDFVHLDAAAQTVALRTHHRPAQLVQPGPCRLVLAKAQDPLQSKCAHTVHLRHPLSRAEPEGRRRARTWKIVPAVAEV